MIATSFAHSRCGSSSRLRPFVVKRDLVDSALLALAKTLDISDTYRIVHSEHTSTISASPESLTSVITRTEVHHEVASRRRIESPLVDLLGRRNAYSATPVRG